MGALPEVGSGQLKGAPQRPCRAAGKRLVINGESAHLLRLDPSDDPERMLPTAEFPPQLSYPGQRDPVG